MNLFSLCYVKLFHFIINVLYLFTRCVLLILITLLDFYQKNLKLIKLPGFPLKNLTRLNFLFHGRLNYWINFLNERKSL